MASESTTPNRKNVSLETKMQIISEIEAGRSRKHISEAYELPLSTIGTIWTHKSKINEASSLGEMSPKRKRMRSGANPEVDKSLLQWFSAVRSEHIPVNGPILQQKAEEIASKLGLINFSADKNWVDRFKQRHNIVSRSVSGESSKVDNATVTLWQESTLPNLIRPYAARDIFNADEMGMFYKMLPQRTLQYKGENCHGGKKSKERLTVMACSNMDGSEKLKPLVIGKFLKPRCFKNVQSLPVTYRANKRAWMTSEIFMEWVESLNKKMRTCGRHILLFIDNCTAHPKSIINSFSNVKFAYFPADTTSVLQPMDQGVIFNLKSKYRRLLQDRYIKCIDDKSECQINILDGIHMIHRAWRNVSPSCVANCFKKVGFVQEDVSEPGMSAANSLVSDSDDDEDDIPLMTLMKRLAPVDNSEGSNITFDDYVNVDVDVLTCASATLEDIVSDICPRTDEVDEEEEAEDDDQPTREMPVPKSDELLSVMPNFYAFFRAQNETPECVFDALALIESQLKRSQRVQKKQKKISDFFGC